MARWTIVTMLALLVAPLAAAQTPPPPDREALLANVRKILAEDGEYAAIEYVESLGSKAVIAKAFQELVMDLHWKAKDVPGTVAVARGGILHFLSRGRALQKTDPRRAATYLGQAKVLAYNLGSFAWPGWGEEGCVYSDGDVKAGREAARLNLRLALDLKRPAKAVSAAWWLHGAHALAAGDADEAKSAFRDAAKLAREAGDEEGALMNQGYLAVAGLLAGEDGVKKAHEDAVAALRKRGTDDAKFYADQVESVPRALRAWRERKGSER